MAALPSAMTKLLPFTLFLFACFDPFLVEDTCCTVIRIDPDNGPLRETV